MRPQISTFFVVCLLVNCFDLNSAAPRPLQLSPSVDGKRLERIYRLGLDKEGIATWSVDSENEAGLLRNAPDIPAIYVKGKPQLTGNLGNAEAPRRLTDSEQYKEAQDDPPRPGLVSPPGGLRSLTASERESIASEFLLRYNYTGNGESMNSLVQKMQHNYGLQKSGQLDDGTVLEMLRPRCGTPEAPAAFSTFAGRPHWTNIPVTYKITGYTPDMNQCQTRNAIKRAFRVWEEVTNLDFTEVGTDDSADIIIYFGYEEHGDGYPFDGSNGLLAHAFGPGRSAISGDTHFDEGEFWTLGGGKVFDTYYGNAGGDPCHFPFYYNGKEYHTCTSDGRSDGLEWCATTRNYTRDTKYAFCPHEKLFTYGGNGEGQPCVFPFEFLGKKYDSCTFEGRSDGYRWCSVTSDFDTDKKWGFCPERAYGTTGGNSNGKSCKFPFTFEGYTYDRCTTRGRSDYRMWCSTTDNFDQDGQWGFCRGNGYSLFLVAAHEFGHAIGLDHSTVGGALMYPSYSFVSDFVLPDDDRRGAQSLYGGPRTKPLTPLRLEKCGGDLSGSGLSTAAPTTTPAARSSTTTVATTTTEATTTTRRSRILPTTTAATTTPRQRSCDTSVRPKSICERPIDAVMTFQGELFIFQGPFVWRVKGTKKQQRRHLAEIGSYWRELKCGVDAAYQRPHDGMLVFFKDGYQYMYRGLSIESGYPRPITEMGLPLSSKISDVVYMKWGKRNTDETLDRTYYFVGEKVYRADNQNSMVTETEKPGTLGGAHWKGVPSNPDAVYRESLLNAFTVFIKDGKMMRYENRRQRLKPFKTGAYSINISKFFSC